MLLELTHPVERQNAVADLGPLGELVYRAKKVPSGSRHGDRVVYQLKDLGALTTQAGDRTGK